MARDSTSYGHFWVTPVPRPGADRGRRSRGGAGLAAAVALRARDQHGPQICFQLLNQPELDDRQETWSAPSHGSQAVLSAGVSQRQIAELGAVLRRALAGCAGGRLRARPRPAPGA